MSPKPKNDTGGVRRCPVCRYDLRGLPEEHRCPECGMAIDESTIVWRMEKLSKFVIGIQIFAVASLLIPLIDYLRGGGLKRQLVFAAVLASIVILYVGVARIRKRPRALLSRDSYATRGRFSWRFEVFALADLEVVSREPLVVRVSQDVLGHADRRAVSMPFPWMSPRQQSEFREAFIEKWQRCHESPQRPAVCGSDDPPP